ncbi:MAG: hypothetical protein EBU46_19020 [Nitrosomonadaceae bacterium]|nr:hypothetical protein [Nitrosomonadaceae bacterium]
MEENTSKAYCAARADLARAYSDPIYLGDPPDACDYCLNPLESESYFGDCMMPGEDYWVYLCSHCIKNNQLEFGWGKGQLYKRVNDSDGDWLLVAGFSRKTTDHDHS